MPQYSARRNRMTIYDLMEAAGKFASNPANAASISEDGTSLYVGPLEYPKMLYHPKGELRIVVPERIEPTPIGPVHIPAQTEMIHRIVQNAAEEDEARSEGWHDHPADAIAASDAALAGLIKVPPKGAGAVLQAKDKEIERLKAELAATRSAGKNARSGAAAE